MPRRNRNATASPATPIKAASTRTSSNSLDHEIAELELLSLDDLRKTWHSKLRSEPPRVRSREFLLRLLTWTIQAEREGGFGPDTLRRLKRLSKNLSTNQDRSLRVPMALPEGATLVREWKGVNHSVEVVAGGYRFEGKSYKTLSKIARLITKTRWSGPRFFGVEEEAVHTMKAKRG